MRRMGSRVPLWCGLMWLLALSMTLGCGSAAPEAEKPPQLVPMAGAAPLQRVTLHITGMS